MLLELTEQSAADMVWATHPVHSTAQKKTEGASKA